MKVQLLISLVAALGSVTAVPMDKRQFWRTRTSTLTPSPSPTGGAEQANTATVPATPVPATPSPSPSPASSAAAEPVKEEGAPAEAEPSLAATAEAASNPQAAESLASSLAVEAATATTEAAAAAPSTDLTPAWGARSRQYLYIWAGAVGRQVPDRLVTFDFDPWSSNYGKMVSQTLTETTGNEPHHCGISVDRKRMVCGGLLSLLKAQDEIFVFDIETDPAHPKLIRTTKSTHGSIPDEFVPMADNTFLLSNMGSNSGGSPGRIAKVDSNGNVLAEYPENPPADFNPHGVQVRTDLNLMATCDYVDPASTLNMVPGGVVLRSSIRIWNLKEMKIVNTIYTPQGSGTMDCKMYHKDPRARGYMGGSGNGEVYQWDSAAGTAKKVINMNDDVISWFFMKPFYTVTAQYMAMTPDDRFLFIPYVSAPGRWNEKQGYYSGIVSYDVSDPNAVRKVHNERFPAYAGPHLCHIMGNRLVTTDYFLDEDDFGKIHMDGDHVVRVFTISSSGVLYPEPRFQVDMDEVIPGIELRPHGMGMN
jgi:selenium-binding protein 1